MIAEFHTMKVHEDARADEEKREERRDDTTEVRKWHDAIVGSVDDIRKLEYAMGIQMRNSRG